VRARYGRRGNKETDQQAELGDGFVEWSRRTGGGRIKVAAKERREGLEREKKKERGKRKEEGLIEWLGPAATSKQQK
jgi:hypothetical protein